MHCFILSVALSLIVTFASASPFAADLSARDHIPYGLAVANKWRLAFRLRPFTWQDDLEDNASQTGLAGNGQNQVHQLPPANGAKKVGQVITPGNSNSRPEYGTMSPFEIAYLSWLCEVRTDPQTKDVCPGVTKANAITYCSNPPQCRAHHDILTDPIYEYIGCAFTRNPDANANSRWNGLYVCSLRSG